MGEHANPLPQPQAAGEDVLSSVEGSILNIINTDIRLQWHGPSYAAIDPRSVITAARRIAARLVSSSSSLKHDGVTEALKVAEAALLDIGESLREPGDYVAWCELRAAQALPIVRAALSARPVETPQGGDEWVLVPREATRRMANAGSFWTVDGDTMSPFQLAEKAWDAMIAAAPPPPGAARPTPPAPEGRGDGPSLIDITRGQYAEGYKDGLATRPTPQPTTARVVPSVEDVARAMTRTNFETCANAGETVKEFEDASWRNFEGVAKVVLTLLNQPPPQPTTARAVVNDLFDRRIDVGAPTGERCTREIVRRYYAPYFEPDEAKRLADVYISQLLALLDQPAPSPIPALGDVERLRELSERAGIWTESGAGVIHEFTVASVKFVRSLLAQEPAR